MKECGAQKVFKQMASNLTKDINLCSRTPLNDRARSEEYIVRLFRCANVTEAHTQT